MNRSATLLLLALVAVPQVAAQTDGNRLTYLDENNPYYVSKDFPKLTTPQWVGEEGVEAVVILAIDDMRDTARYEAYLRPILQRLKEIDGRAPVSIMTCNVKPDDPQLQSWLDEGLSIEVHTVDHPCPLLQGGNFAKAKSTYDRCVDLMNLIPNNKPVAFRMPCCDSLNTVSPRFYAEIFNKTTKKDNYLSIDTSVFNIFTSDDPDIPRELVIDEDGQDKFLKYIPKNLIRNGAPFNTFVNTIRNYPYPYVINRLCWEFPCVAPSDWSAQHLQGKNNPDTLRDWKAALDITVLKQGVMNLVFHPHGWIRNDQVVELIDYAVKKHGKKVKFLNFREAANRLNTNLTAGVGFRRDLSDKKDSSFMQFHGYDQGTRIVDIDNDGYMDVIVTGIFKYPEFKPRITRIWQPDSGTWKVLPLPVLDDDLSVQFRPVAIGFEPPFDAVYDAAQLGVVRHDASASIMNLGLSPLFRGIWHFEKRRGWSKDGKLTPFLRSKRGVLTPDAGIGCRMRDVDGDGIQEVLIFFAYDGGERADVKQGIYKLKDDKLEKMSLKVPPRIYFEDTTHFKNPMASSPLRFVDVNNDGFDDIVFSDHECYGIWLFKDTKSGWSIEVIAGKGGERKPDEELPPIVRKDGSDNGFFVHSRHLFWQNEGTAGLPDLVDRRSFNDLLKNVEPKAKSPKAGLQSMHVRPGFRVELVAAEPLVMDPVAFDWGSDGKLWVVEMADYPLGIDGKGKHGGRVRFLEDTNNDGKYDKSTLFLDGVPYPNGIMPWRDGVLVSAAPDVFYAADTDGDGKADLKRVLFTGFREGNQQHRVNGFAWGLDNWVHLANGDSGGSIKAVQTVSGNKLKAKPVNFSGRDLRIWPDEGLLDPQSGQSQFGRNRDDWGNWFGNNNSHPLFHFILADHYLRRNPHFAPPAARVEVPETPGATPVFPASRTLPRFNDHDRANRFTSACSSIIYRDNRFGPHFAANMFVCEPVHNLVSRQVLTQKGIRFSSRRAPDEQESEFLASTDNWFRPVFLRTGPDGALWIADMYRHVIEHPQWIPNDWQRRLDLRAGHDKGRIYRVVPVTGKRSIPRLDQSDGAGLVAALDSPNGWQRDTAQRLLIHKQDRSAIEPLNKMVLTNKRPLARLHALCTLDGLGALDTDLLLKALSDKHPAIRRHAIRLSEPFLSQSEPLINAVLQRVADTDVQVQLQLAYSLGEIDHSQASNVLTKLAQRHVNDPYLLAAVMSSLNNANVGAVLEGLTSAKSNIPARLLGQVLGMTVKFNNKDAVTRALARITKSTNGDYSNDQMRVLSSLLEALNRQRIPITKLLDKKRPEHAAILNDLQAISSKASTTARSKQAKEADRLVAIRFLGMTLGNGTDVAADLGKLLVLQESFEVQSAAVAALNQIGDDSVPTVLLTAWKGHGPRLRSRIVESLLSRTSWSSKLTSRIESRHVLPAEIDTVHRLRLLKHRDVAIRSKAEKLFGGAVDPQRQKVVDSYRKALQLKPNSITGAAVFKKRCSTCHKLKEIGKPVGPDLAALKDKSPTTMLTAILDPNKAVESKFINYTAVTEGGLAHSGMLVSESGNSITLSAADGKQTTLLRSEIETLVSSNKSFMPEGMEKDLSLQDMADVIAFVAGTNPPPKSFPGNKPELIRPDNHGRLTLAATNAEIYGPSIIFEPTYKNIGFWRREADHVVWPIETDKSNEYTVYLNYACDNATAGNRFVLQIGNQNLTGKVDGTGTWDEYRNVEIGRITLSAGRQHATFRSDGNVRGYMIDLRAIELIPKP